MCRYEEFIDTERKPESARGLKPTLATGLYLLKIKSDLGLVILWPEKGFYTEKDAIMQMQLVDNEHKSKNKWGEWIVKIYLPLYGTILFYSN